MHLYRLKILELYISKYPWKIDDEVISVDYLLEKSLLDEGKDCVEHIKKYGNGSLSCSKVSQDKIC